MSTTTHSHPPQSRLALSTLDRLVLKVGLALVSYARRPRRTLSRDEQRRRADTLLATARREQDAERLYRLTVG